MCFQFLGHEIYLHLGFQYISHLSWFPLWGQAPNAFKDIPLQERNEAPFPNQMLPYSVKKEHCLMTGLQLLGLYLDCKDNEEKKREMIERIFITDGVFTEYQNWTSFIITEDTDTTA